MIEATLFGKPLPDGGTIGVVAAASPHEGKSEVYRGVEWWESHGYHVKLGDGVFAIDDYVAGDPEQRAADLNALFADPEVDVVQVLQGGYGSAQLIPHIDFDVIAANPKPFIGYSDITALHVAIRQRTGLATLYGYGLAGVGTASRRRSRSTACSRCSGRGRRRGAARSRRSVRARDRPGQGDGPLVGGCFWLLIQTMGTPWEIELEGAILFFEDVKLPPYFLDGFLNQLRDAGKLQQVAGVVVGEMKDCDYGDMRESSEWPRSRTLEDVLDQYLEPLGVPVLYKLPLGHGKHLASLPLGVRCTLDADMRSLSVDEPAFRE